MTHRLLFWCFFLWLTCKKLKQKKLTNSVNAFPSLFFSHKSLKKEKSIFRCRNGPQVLFLFVLWLTEEQRAGEGKLRSGQGEGWADQEMHRVPERDRAAQESRVHGATLQPPLRPGADSQPGHPSISLLQWVRPQHQPLPQSRSQRQSWASSQSPSPSLPRWTDPLCAGIWWRGSPQCWRQPDRGDVKSNGSRHGGACSNHCDHSGPSGDSWLKARA